MMMMGGATIHYSPIIRKFAITITITPLPHYHYPIAPLSCLPPPLVARRLSLENINISYRGNLGLCRVSDHFYRPEQLGTVRDSWGTAGCSTTRKPRFPLGWKFGPSECVSECVSYSRQGLLQPPPLLAAISRCSPLLPAGPRLAPVSYWPTPRVSSVRSPVRRVFENLLRNQKVCP